MPRDDDTLDLGPAQAIAERLVAEGRKGRVEEACRAGLRRLAEDAAVVDRLVRLGEDGMASGLAEGFDIDAFVEDARRGRNAAGKRSSGEFSALSGRMPAMR